MKLCGQQYIHPDVGFFCLVTDLGVMTFGGGREEAGEAEVDFVYMARII